LSFDDALQLIMMSVCTGFGLELAKEFAHDFISKIRIMIKKVKGHSDK
jgi:hypothetical protein